MSFPTLKAILALAVFDPVMAKATERIMIENVGLAAPESVMHDTVDGVYTPPTSKTTAADEDGNGFISRITPDGNALVLKWTSAEGTISPARTGALG